MSNFDDDRLIEALAGHLDPEACNDPASKLGIALRTELLVRAEAARIEKELRAVLRAEDFALPASLIAGPLGLKAEGLQPKDKGPVESWARSLSMTAEAALEALRALLSPQRFEPAYAASSQERELTPRQLPGRTGEYTLTVTAALNDPNVFYLIIQVNEQQISLAEGREVTVRIGDVSYPMGLIDENGVAELEVRSPLLRSEAMEVSFGRRKTDPELN